MPGKNHLLPPLPEHATSRAIFLPDRFAGDFWAGAPSVCADEDGAVWMVFRKGRWEGGTRRSDLYLARSEDGIAFEIVREWTAPSFGCIRTERAALLRDPQTGRFKLYVTRDLLDKPPSLPEYHWDIARLDDADSPERFDLSSIRQVLGPGEEGPDAGHVKDPYVFTLGHRYLMFYIGADRELREGFLCATSTDGERWERSAAGPLLGHDGWHSFAVRPSCVLDTPQGFLVFYEGSHPDWDSPVFNIQTGLATTADFRTVTDLTPEQPLLSAPAAGPFRTFRYMEILRRGDRLLYYYEAARDDGSNELRVSAVPLEPR